MNQKYASEMHKIANEYLQAKLELFGQVVGRWNDEHEHEKLDDYRKLLISKNINLIALEPLEDNPGLRIVVQYNPTTRFVFMGKITGEDEIHFFYGVLLKEEKAEREVNA